ncbi:hypothetical protein FSP39_005775 [Pinctada imbricata]|uniref:Uncharacterized protein n=1 Tax=Pinctada imbricata TaxID=66713 RepID=A0AA89C6P3_PINIB|nr:hypothetical protein FSP39_005775 [Pinctada imbricata]
MADDFVTNISTVSVVLFIAAGALFFFLVFILAKRQIMRFASKSSGHPIAAGAPKNLKKEISEKLEMTKSVRFEPLLLSPKVLQTATTVPNHYLYRMKAVDAFSKFDELMKLESISKEKKHPSQSIRQYLIGLCHELLKSSSLDIVNQFCDAYEHARHDPDEFGETQYNRYIQLLEQMTDSFRSGIPERSVGDTKSVKRPVSTEVIFSPDLKDGNTKTFVSKESTNTKNLKRNVPSDLRFRPRAGSSGHSSLLDSGHSSQPSSELTDKGSTEKIALVELANVSNKGEFV